jgi:eukaryotic-like serine/threonine-protein kinase
VLRLRRTLVEVRALREVGALHAAFAKAQTLRRDIEAAGYRPLLGKTLTEIGMLQTDLGLPAEQTLEDGVFAAEAARDDLTVATASAALVFIVGFRLDRLDDAERWARLSAAALDRLVKSQESERVRGWLLHDHAIALFSHRKFEPGLALMQQAVALKERTVGKDHPDTALSLSGLGGCLTYIGRSDEAVLIFERAIEIVRRHGDPETPWLAGILNNEGDALLRLRRFPAASAAFTASLTLQAEAPTVNQDGRFTALKGLGRAELGIGDLPRARAHLEQALDVAQKTDVIWSELVEAQLAMAEVLWTREPDRVRAVSLVRSAERAYASHGASYLDQKDEIDTWLATHVLPTKRARRL